jgi:hypothetical protein
MLENGENPHIGHLTPIKKKGDIGHSSVATSPTKMIDDVAPNIR